MAVPSGAVAVAMIVVVVVMVLRMIFTVGRTALSFHQDPHRVTNGQGK